MGGKTRELDIINSLLPQQFNRVIEPFAGGAALSFALGKETWLNDTNEHVINLYEVVQNPQTYSDLINRMQPIIGLTGNNALIETEYYRYRNMLNNKSWSDKVEWAQTYLTIRHLVFSGMERKNNKGHFNAPFGHNKYVNLQLNDKHHQFLKDKVKLTSGDFESVIDAAAEDDFIFIDPPYWNRAQYDTDFGLDDHIRLADALKRTKAKWMIVHTDDPLYQQLYVGYQYLTNPFQYAINYKGAPNSQQKVQHAYIMNY